MSVVLSPSKIFVPWTLIGPSFIFSLSVTTQISLKFNPYGKLLLNFSIAVPKLAVEESNSSYYTYLPLSIILKTIFLFYSSVTTPIV